jgi:hypothetical protein
MASRRVRNSQIARAKSILKSYAWRLTALLCWVHLTVHICGGELVLKSLNATVFSITMKLLSRSGFAPGHASLLPFLLKLLWLLFITAFSWAQMIGLVLYVVFWPLTLLFLFRHRETLKSIREQRVRKIHTLRHLTPDRPVWTYALITSLTGWFVLYGGSSLRIPLITAIILTGLLFADCVYRAFVYTALEVPTGRGWIDRYIAAVIIHFEQVVKTIKEQKAIDLKSLSVSLSVWRFSQRVLRVLSRWLFGRAARSRAALIALIKYLSNLCVLGSIAILFWALVIRYFSVPQMANVTDSMLASASRVIPGVPEPTSLSYPDWVKAATSITAWLVFVLYAGPAASLFPLLQERYVKETANLYKRLRIARKTLYEPVHRLDTVVRMLREHPELQSFVNMVIFFKLQPDLNQLFQAEPDAARILSERPDLVQVLANAGVTLPKLEDFLPPIPMGNETNLPSTLPSPTLLPSNGPLAEVSNPEREVRREHTRCSRRQRLCYRYAATACAVALLFHLGKLRRRRPRD